MLWCLVVISCARCVKKVIENARHAHVMWIVILGYICNDSLGIKRTGVMGYERLRGSAEAVHMI